MKKNPHISGIHHITAIASSAADNLAFYEQVLGLRLVKRTVNFDDPYTYHFYYGDGQGSPGTILTFFPWENLPKGRPGAGMVTSMAFAVARSSMDYWQERMSAFGLESVNEERFGDPVIRFTDPHGLPLELIGMNDAPAIAHWTSGPVDHAHGLRGFHSATATVNELEGTEHMLTNDMGMTLIAREQNRLRYETASSGPGRWLDVVHDPEAPKGRPGGGTVHHIAFRAKDDEEQLQWQNLLRRRGLAVTAVRDRNYFRSIYYQTPAGILFEIATDPPGFTKDEPVERLGTTLKIPSQYETLRDAINGKLPALREKTYHHLYEPPAIPVDQGDTLVTLHGTGGNEGDLLHLAKAADNTMAVISPRGNVRENGMPRFFKRLANNVLDENDVKRRVQELSGFLTDAALRYGRDPQHLIALGYSNGANIAAAVMMLRPEIFSSAILLRPMLPLSDAELPDLSGKPILVLRGARDTAIPSASTDKLISRLESCGAEVTTRIMDAGHEITPGDLEEISRWLEQHGSRSIKSDNPQIRETA